MSDREHALTDDDAEVVDALVVEPGDDAAREPLAAARPPLRVPPGAPSVGGLAPRPAAPSSVPARVPVAQAAAMAATGFAAGAVTAAVVRTVGKRRATKAATRAGARHGLPIVGTRSFLVDVHLIGPKD